ncbi:HAD family hydrolase [Thiolapillus sp.]|uniref:HAD family hydrolase n=1 Tax=Thiolapillus sp. TaxID=2017437 RepID=UPI0025EE9D33|nr:HAD family hydrolase [Thiolapillus sp.]
MFDKLRLLTFDLDDTLWATAPVILAAERRLHRWLMLHAPEAAANRSIEVMRKQRLDWMANNPSRAHDLTLVRLKTLEALLDEFGYPPSLAVQGLQVFRQARNQVVPWGDVLPVLKHLRRHYTLVSLTNGNAQVEHTPLKSCFHLSLSAEDVGAAKPHPAMFHEVARRFGLDFGEMLHVGDDWERDILPSARLGMATAWVHRQPLGGQNRKRADLCLFNLYPLRVYLTKQHI